MKMQLIHRNRVPYGGLYEINKPEIGMKGRATTFDSLILRVAEFRQANAIPIGLGFQDDLEREICKLYPQECEFDNSILPFKNKLYLSDVIHGTKVIASFKAAGSPYVSREEALRRGAICSKCPLCQPFPRTCAGMCGELKAIVDSLLTGYSTPYDQDERACSICHCFYSGHIRIPYVHLKKGLTDEMTQQFQTAHDEPSIGCWKVPGAL